jgi:hypothetical protein
MIMQGLITHEAMPPFKALPRGGIVGRANVVDCVKPGFPHRWAQDPWYVGDFGIVLADVEPLPFRPWKGALGLFEVDEDVLATKAERVEGVTR